METLLTSRKFWVTAITLVLLVVVAFFPSFQLDPDQAASLLLVIVPYLIGIAVDPGLGWRGLLSSRKFWAGLVGLMVILLDAFQLLLPQGLTPELLITFCSMIGAYIGGVAIEHYVKPATEPTIEGNPV